MSNLYCAVFSRLIRTFFAAAAALALCLLTSCGGGGGGGGGTSSGGSASSAPYILASVVSFPTGAVPAGFASANTNSVVSVDVLNNSTGAPISNATVTVNGTPFAYSNTYQDYWQNMNIAPGQAVTVAVTVNGTTFTVTGNQAVSYPNISSPQAGATWYANTSNTLSWTGTLSGSTGAYLLGMVDSSLNLLWPSSSSFQVVSASTNAYPVNAYSVPVGNPMVMVGAAQSFPVPNAATNSALIIEGFNTVALNVVASAPLPLASIAITPTGSTMSRGKTRQLTATGSYSGSYTTQDISSQVTWQSSDPTLITVSNTGLATAVGTGAGSVTITAALSGFQASTTINLFVPTPSPSLPLDHSAGFQVDYAHTGRIAFSSSLSFPSQAAWSITLGDEVSFPVVADGKVFVTTGTGAGYGSRLYAIDQATGSILWGPIALPGTYFRAGIAHSNGKIFVVNFDGLVRTFDAATGASGWSTSLPYYNVNEPPTVANGIVYISGNSRIAALDEANGNILSTASFNATGYSAVTVGDNGIFVGCLYKFDPVMGTQLWANTTDCNSYGGSTSAYFNGQIFTPTFFGGTGSVFSSSTGAALSGIGARTVPAFLGNTGFFLNGGVLKAVDLNTRATLWSYSGSGSNLATPPLVINQTVFIGASSGIVYALDATTGALQWSGTAGTTILPPDEWNGSTPLVGLGAGAGYLVVPAGNQLTAWRLY